MSASSPKPVALVTGASAGIGAIYAARLAERGYDLILVARRADRLKALSDKLGAAHGTKVEVVEADLTKDADVTRVEKVLKENSAITLLVNNAGNSTLAPVAKTAEEDAAAMIALNVTALTRLTHAILPAFLSRNLGAIINVASVLSFHALPISAIYSGTKGYVMNFSRGLQQELAETNVRLQLVMPAATATELWDLSGVPLASLNQATVMTSENLVDAALAGFDKGEDITLPSVADASLWDKFDQARSTLFAATQTGEPAPRYRAV
ncbi:SDR family oxidoreductase [Rhizobium laguerreae]|uniref:NADP-dependent 3-hydroxy acid dehydrogenase YdfG n=1 Tax=Rhizobium laguerreae TaxID=1076926 RepID=A0AAJ3A0E6_9HYPH|nr:MULTISPECIES: SDR family oxidoreductase [Rhizobium]MBN9984204.1 SDR family oxidoreductase [Rhizobium laguerreae]MBY3053072.1 SDR family oxidoreductase [Rhizobium laguerreae]MBY3066316.1 SDR family oxidoreductase [Rhizobium laguerreae]MBY3080785.1 SDR family oxidoreductase [Rhizobium laguerreae]MBY3092879.1 SDR family oxidoreductase [Rhizobium laguerreae]